MWSGKLFLQAAVLEQRGENGILMFLPPCSEMRHYYAFGDGIEINFTAPCIYLDCGTILWKVEQKVFLNLMLLCS